MLLCCVDLIFANAIADKRKDLVNSGFSAIPIDWLTVNGGESYNNKPICIMNSLCERHEGSIVDALRTKAYEWRKLIEKYIQSGILKCNKNTFLGMLTMDNFESNLNSLKKKYEAYVLGVGEIDEGIFLAQLDSAATNQCMFPFYFHCLYIVN